ncbi:MAG: putative membrane protein [Myxococcota bacterium]|jgi:uncharacterized membrane protein
MRRHFGIFLQGTAIIAPVIVTLYVVYASMIWLDNIIKSWLGDYLPSFPFIGLIFAIACIWVVGLLSQMYLFGRIVGFWEEQIARVPLIKTLYGSVRDMLRFFDRDGDRPRGEAVRIDLGPEAHMLGITTNEDDGGRVGVYLPLSYQIGGFLVYFPREKLSVLDMDVETALKFIMTGGIGSEAPTGDADALPPAPPAEPPEEAEAA